jgi:hypothetical protein
MNPHELPPEDNPVDNPRFSITRIINGQKVCLVDMNKWLAHMRQRYPHGLPPAPQNPGPN